VEEKSCKSYGVGLILVEYQKIVPTKQVGWKIC
jgi:hypothetical protein